MHICTHALKPKWGIYIPYIVSIFCLIRWGWNLEINRLQMCRVSLAGATVRLYSLFWDSMDCLALCFLFNNLHLVLHTFHLNIPWFMTLLDNYLKYVFLVSPTLIYYLLGILSVILLTNVIFLLHEYFLSCRMFSFVLVKLPCRSDVSPIKSNLTVFFVFTKAGSSFPINSSLC